MVKIYNTYFNKKIQLSFRYNLKLVLKKLIEQIKILTAVDTQPFYNYKVCQFYQHKDR